MRIDRTTDRARRIEAAFRPGEPLTVELDAETADDLDSLIKLLDRNAEASVHEIEDVVRTTPDWCI